MRKTPTILFAALVAVMLLAVNVPAKQRGIQITSRSGESLSLYSKGSHALVVGVNDYEWWPDLPNAVKDAEEVSEVLKRLGFTVKLVSNPSSRELKAALTELAYKHGREINRAILFYYAGHGATEKLADGTDLGYIVPKDCPLLRKNPHEFLMHAISMKDIEAYSLRIISKHVLMLFDSCFSGSIFSLVRAIPEDISEKSALPVRQYITAGREYETVPDRSTFKRCFLLGLEGDADLTGDGYITGSELGMYLADKVVQYTQGTQHPLYGKINNPDLDRGDFIFVPLATHRKQVAEGKKLEEEKDTIAEEIKKLREERGKSEELVEQLKKILEAKSLSDAKERDIEDEKRELEERLKRLEEKQQKDKRLETDKVRDLETKRRELEETHRKEAAEKKALEEELKRLKAEKEKTPPKIEEKKDKKTEDKRLAYIPKTTKGLDDILKNGQGPFLVDDFEDKDLYSTNRYFKWITRFKGDAKIRMSVDDTQGANGSSCSMKIKYELGGRSNIFISPSRSHTFPNKTPQEASIDKSFAFDLSRFVKVVFYLKEEKARSFFSKPNKIFFMLHCYDDDAVLKSGKRTGVSFYQKTVIRPDKTWQRIEISFDDLVPNLWTKNNVNHYSDKPDLQSVIGASFMISRWGSAGGGAESNILWIDEVKLE